MSIRSDSKADKCYYESNYHNIDLQNPNHKLAFYKTLLNQSIPKGSKIFELGFGLGHFLNYIKDDYIYSGSDINNFAVNQVRAKFPKLNLELGSTEILSPGMNLDAIVAWDVLEHIEDIQTSLNSIKASLKTNGVLIVVVPIYDGALGHLVRLLDSDPTHIHKCSRKYWLNLLSSSGFNVQAYGGIIRYLLPWGYYLHITKPRILLKFACSAYFFIARNNRY